MATIKDVAKLAGVGLGTASRVVSGKGSVSPATLARVKKAIDELGFRPSHAARALLSGTSRMVGVYIPVLSGTFYTPILQIIDTELRAAGVHMVLAFGVGLGDERRQAIEGVEFLVERGCDGFVIAATIVPGSYADFVKHVVPELQRRGLYHKDYAGNTLRENLGLKRPQAGAWKTQPRAAAE